MKYLISLMLVFVCGCQHTPTPEKVHSLLVMPSGIFKFNHATGKTWMFIGGRWLPVAEMTDAEGAAKVDELNGQPTLQQKRLPQLRPLASE